MTKLEIRKARHRDLPAVLQLLSEAEDRTPMSPPDAIHVYRKMWQYRDYTWYLAFEGARLVGIFSVLVFPTLLHGGGCEGIVHLVVAADRRGRGIGSRMMAKAMQMCVDARCATVMLATIIGEDIHELGAPFAHAQKMSLPIDMRRLGRNTRRATPHPVRVQNG